MRHIPIKSFIVAALFMMISPGCKKILEEEPRSIFTPEFFKTERGVQGGVTALYANLRFLYGQPYYYNTLETGTDEYTYGQSADANFRDMDYTSVSNLNSTSSRTDAIWDISFQSINTANGIVENAAAVSTISPALVAEARFFRAFYY